MILDLYDKAPFARGVGMKPGVIADNAARKVEEFDVRTPSVSAAVGTLSGGNQQKVVLARELSRPLRLFIASQPPAGSTSARLSSSTSASSQNVTTERRS